MCVWGGGHNNCNASLSLPNVQKNSRALVRRMGVGGLKFEKINAGKTIKSAHKEKLGIGSPLFCCTFSFIPHTITKAQHGSSLGTGALF